MKKEFVNWTIFAWTISIIIGLFTIGFTFVARANVKADDAYTSIYGIKKDIGLIENNIGWIKKDIKEIKDKI